MRGYVDAVVRAVMAALPSTDEVVLRRAVERGIASVAMDTAGAAVVASHLARVEETEEAAEKAQILRELADTLEHERGDAERALVVRLAAFAEAARPADLDALLRLARATDRWSELPLDQMKEMLDGGDDAGPRRLRELAAILQRRGDVYGMADCYERVLVFDPGDTQAGEALELFYRSTGEWGQLVDLLERRDVAHGDPEIAREIAVTYERELGDDASALEWYAKAPQDTDTLEARARILARLGQDSYDVLEQLAAALTEPARRANVLLRAANLCQNVDRAQELFEQALVDDPTLVAAVEGLALLLRDRGEMGGVADVYQTYAERFPAERSRWLAEAADFRLAEGDTERAKQLYRAARAADPHNHKAGLALVELGFDTGTVGELVPILDELCASTTEPGRLRGYLLQRSKVAGELGDLATARATLARAVELDPHDPMTRRQLADMLFEHDWLKARELYEGLLEDHEDLFHAEVSIELHYRVARCARELGDVDGAAKHAAVTLALDPQHRGALLLRKELATGDTAALLADELALANLAPISERGARFENLGDRYATLGDRATAREMFREALAHRPSDHLLLTKFLGLVADEGDWSYALDLVQRLVETEKDPKVRARYRHLAAMIARDELGNPDRSITLFSEAVVDDAHLFTAADELEAMLDGAGLALFLGRRLAQLKTDEGRSGEALRLWDRLGACCQELGRFDDAVAAREVGARLDPSQPRKEALAALYLMGDGKHDGAAIALHHELLRGNKRRMGSYQALRTLHRRQHHAPAVRAMDDALAVLGAAPARDKLEAVFGNEPTGERRVAPRPLANDDFLALARIDVDLQLSALAALLAPAYAAERARTRPVPPAPKPSELSLSVARVFDRVVAAFAMPRPLVVVDKTQALACQVAMRLAGAQLVPVVLLGAPVLETVVDDQELAFAIARRLCDLRSERLARLLAPRELPQLLELAASGSGAWLTPLLPKGDIEQAFAIGARYRGLDHARLAADWLAANDRAADRIGLVVVDELAPCTRVIAREAAADASARTIDLAWASITEEVLAIRAKLWR